MDLGAKFGIALGSDSDSSDAEFAPENEEKDSADSECGGGGSGSSGEEGGDEEEETEEEIGDEGEGKGDEGEGKGENDALKEEQEQEEGAGKGSDGGDQEVEKKTDVVREGDEGETIPTQESGGGIEEVVQQSEKDTSPAKTEDNLASSDPAATNKEGGDEDSDQDKEMDEYNPLVVRRSNRAIKPTKDVDLYLLGAKFGIDVADVEASGAESSDMEFAPAENSPGILVVHVYPSVWYGEGCPSPPIFML